MFLKVFCFVLAMHTTKKEIAEKIGMPCFVKPATDGSSFGVSKVKNADQLAPALRKAFMESSEVMVESFL